MSNKKDTTKQRTSGSLGGKSTLEKYGKIYFSELVKKRWRAKKRAEKKKLKTSVIKKN